MLSTQRDETPVSRKELLISEVFDRVAMAEHQRTGSAFISSSLAEIGLVWKVVPDGFPSRSSTAMP